MQDIVEPVSCWAHVNAEFSVVSRLESIREKMALIPHYPLQSRECNL